MKPFNVLRMRKGISVPPTSTRVDVISRSVDAANAASGAASASIIFSNTGAFTTSFSPTGSASGGNYSWLLTGAVADYDIMASNHSGDAPTGQVLNTWLNLATTRNWGITAGPDMGTLGWSLTISIRDKVTLVVLESADFGCSATGGVT